MFKRPVIASNVADRRSAYRTRRCLLFDVADASSLAQAIRRACTEKGLWTGWSKDPAACATHVMVDSFLSRVWIGPQEHWRCLLRRQPSERPSVFNIDDVGGCRWRSGLSGVLQCDRRSVGL